MSLFFQTGIIISLCLDLGVPSTQMDGTKKTSAIYAFHPVDNIWQHVGDMCSSIDTLLLSGGRLLVVNGDNQRVLRVTVEGKPCKCYGHYY